MLPPQVGNLVVHPVNEALPVASMLNFLPGQIIANTTIVPITPGSVNNFWVYNNSDGATPVVIDVVGHFWENQASDCTRAADQSLAGGASAAVVAACAAGYVASAGACSTDTVGAMTWLDRRATSGGTGYSCTARNDTGGAANLTADTLCCRKAGR